jgi:phosphonatase-like hydrolase
MDSGDVKIELVVFDVAGTTVRDDDAVNDCLRAALAAAGVRVTRAEVNQVMGIAKPVAIGKLLERHGGPTRATSAHVRDIHDDFLRRMIAHYTTSEAIQPMPHAEDTLMKLRRAGVRVALDTGFSRTILDTVLERLDWTGTRLFDATVASDEVVRGRPHPDLVFKAMELTGVTNPAAVAKVGDTPADLEEGTAARCGLVVGVMNGSHTGEELRRHPHTHLISHLGLLPKLVLGQGLIPAR